MFDLEDKKITVTVTIGAVYYQNDITLEEWIALADQKMYEGKGTGKNKTII